MSENNDNKRKLYDALSKDYDMGSYEQFVEDIQDESKRKKLYDVTSKEYDYGDYESFSRQLGMRETHSELAPHAEKNKQKALNPSQQKTVGMSEAKKHKMSQWAFDFSQGVSESTRKATNRIKYSQERAKNPLGIKPIKFGENPNVVEAGKEFDPQTGEMKPTYLTETGNEYKSIGAAEWEQNQIDKAKARALDPINTALRDAYAERDRINEDMRKRMEEINEADKGVGSFLREFVEASHQPDMTNPMTKYQADEQYRQLEAAARKNRAVIQTLEDKRDGKMNEFWHTFAETASDGYTFSDGWSEINDAIALLDAQKHIDTINRKRAEGKPLTHEEKAAEAVLINDAANNEIQARYGGDYGAWARAGGMFSGSLDFMKDIILAPGAGGLAKGIAKKAAEVGGKYFAKRAGDTALKAIPKTVARGVLKATGVMVGAHTAGTLIANTSGLGRTAASIGTNMAGNTIVDENGNLQNENAMGLLEATAEAERSQAREYGSEMFGAFLPSSGKFVTKGLKKLGLSRISNTLTSIGSKDWYKQYSQILKAGGFNGMPGEALEEYEGIAFDALTGKAEEALQQIKDPRTHIDIWLGTATMSALLGAVPMTIQGKHVAQYYWYKHKTDNSDIVAGYRLGQEKWDTLRGEIDQCPNESMTAKVLDILNNNDLQIEEKKAVLDYVRNLTKMRGYNIAQVTNSNQQTLESAAANENYAYGYNAQEDGKLQDIKNLYELQRQRIEEYLPLETVSAIDNDPIGSIINASDEEKQLVIDYVNAQQAHEGMIQRVRDDIDSRINQSNAMVDNRVNRSSGMIQGATLKVQDDEGNDRRVYVLNGNLVTLPNGTDIDYENSDGSIIIRDAATGEIEMISPSAIFSVEPPVDPEMEKQTAAESIRQQFAQEAANRIDGTVAFQPGDTYTVTDESGQAAQIQIVPNVDGLVDNGDGTVNISSDGGQTVLPMRKEDIQAMVDATNRARVAQVEQQREAMQQPQVQEQPTYSLNDEVSLLDENGNEVRGSITADVNEDGQYEVYTENPINGRKVNLFTAEELNRLRADRPNDEQPPVGGASIDVSQYFNNGGEAMAKIEDIIKNGEVLGTLPDGSVRIAKDGFVATVNRDENGEFALSSFERIGGNSAENSLQNGGNLTENGGNLTENGGNSAENLQQEQQPVQTEQPGQSAMDRIPKDEQGQPIYEQAEPDTAWDAIVEQTEGDEAMAQSVADSMVADKEAELKKAEKVKPKGGTTIAEKIAAERERKNAVEQAKANLALWQRIAQTSQRRRQAAMAEQSRQAAEAARLRREQEEQERAAREEAERIRREALNGVPDFVDDTPQDARARGYRRVNGEKVDRQQSIPARQGKEVQVKFDDKNIPTGHVALIEASQLQPSHLNGLRNPLHFIDEAQPKERNDDASVMSARKIAANIRPEEITSSVTAYTGAPTVNTRGEVIQGNNRSAALREMWAGQPEQAAVYKQYLTEHAADFGLAPEDVEAMKQPVLVNMLDVPDEDAINLGQFVAQDTESGGTERIKPKNIVQKMGDDMRSFAGRLLASPDEEMTFSELVDRNGMDALKWMQAKNYITPTQYRSAFDSKGNLTAEAKNDLKGVMYQSIFQNGNTHLEEMFGALPAKAQKAILATAYRDYDSPNTERLNAEIQNSISAYYALSQDPAFANAKNYKEARMAAEAWKRQYALDDVTGESYLPSERYSNFALLLATMYKGQTQTFIQSTFNHIFDLVQGTQEATLFEEPNNTPRSLVEAINETLSNLSEELLLNGNFIYNGQRRNNVLAGSGTTGQPRRQGSPGSSQAGGRIEDGTETSNSSDRAANDKSSGRSERNGGENQGTEKEEPAKGQNDQPGERIQKEEAAGISLGQHTAPGQHEPDRQQVPGKQLPVAQGVLVAQYRHSAGQRQPAPGPQRCFPRCFAVQCPGHSFYPCQEQHRKNRQPQAGEHVDYQQFFHIQPGQRVAGRHSPQIGGRR